MKKSKPQYWVFHLPSIEEPEETYNRTKEWADRWCRSLRTARKYINSCVKNTNGVEEIGEFEVWLVHEGKLLWKVPHEEEAS